MRSDLWVRLLQADVFLVTTGKIMTMEELSNVQGRAWEDVDVSEPMQCQLRNTDCY